MPIAERSKYSLNSEEVEYFTRISREFTITNNRLLGKLVELLYQNDWYNRICCSSWK